MSTIAEECISPELAQQKVTKFLVIGAGNRLYGSRPRQVYDEKYRLYWSVPIMFTSAGDKSMCVGNILVDAHNGRLQVKKNTIDEIIANVKSAAEDETMT